LNRFRQLSTAAKVSWGLVIVMAIVVLLVAVGGN